MAYTPDNPRSLEQQTALFRFIVGYQLAHGGVSPSFDDMADGIGIASKGSTSLLIEFLEDRGCLRRLPRRARAIEVLTPVAIPRAPDGAPLYVVPGFGP